MISPHHPGTPTVRILLVLAVLLGIHLPPAHATARPPSLDQQRHLYQQARAAWESRDLARFARLSDQLRDYPLHPYLEFEQLRTASHARERERIDRFLATMGDMPLANRLRTRLLDEFYAQGNWAMFRAYYADSVRTTALECRYQEA
jgi:soluble lytic murein transglycosylase